MKKTKTPIVKDHAFFSKIGHMGGTANVRKHGEDHMAEIGFLGGMKMKETRGSEFYSRIAKEWRARQREAKTQAQAEINHVVREQS